jgi:hypothetical protein
VATAADLSHAKLSELWREQRYRSVPPAFANLEMLEGRWRGEQERVFFRPNASLPKAVLLKLGNATTAGYGCVMLEDGRVLAETQWARADPTWGPAVHTHEGEAVALLRKPGDGNYGHWMAELLPRVLEFQAAFPGRRLRYAVPSNPFAMRRIRLDSLRWFGIEEDQVIWVGPEPTRFPELLVITSNSIHSHTHDFERVNRVAALGRGSVAIGPGTRKLYVQRPPNAKRKLVGEDHIVSLLTQRGFEVVRPETLSLAEQVRTFAEAQLVVGVSGAALTNILWAEPPCRLIALSPNVGHEFFFWDICNIRGIAFDMLAGPIVGADKLGHSDFTIDDHLILEAIARAQAAAPTGMS